MPHVYHRRMGVVARDNQYIVDKTAEGRPVVDAGRRKVNSTPVRYLGRSISNYLSCVYDSIITAEKCGSAGEMASSY